MKPAETPSICRIWMGNCGIPVRDDGAKTTISGNPDHPVSKGFLCFRGRHYGDVRPVILT